MGEVHWFRCWDMGMRGISFNAIFFCWGDQVLEYSSIKNESAIILANRTARQRIADGKTDFYVNITFNGDWYYAFGRVSIHYMVDRRQSGWTARAVIHDLYDFRDKLSTNHRCPGLSIAGAAWGWNGGDTVWDKWMDDLYTFRFAARYTTHVEWTLYE